MALALNDRVQQTGTANTTVSFTLSGSVTGYQSFAVVGNGNTTYYSATDTVGNWEVGIGTYSTTGPTLTRTTILSSSNSGSAVTFSGTVNVFVTYPSEKSVNLDANGVLTVGQTLSYSDTGIIASFASTVAGYNQVVFQNKDSGSSSSSNINVSHNSATSTTGFAELGINSTTFSGSGSFSIAGASYLASASTDLTIGTYGAYDLHFVTNSNTTDSMTIFDDGGVSLGGLASPGIGTITANKFVPGYSSITSAGGTTSLTSGSNYYQRVVGTSAQTVKMPDATTLLNGTTFIIDNDSTGTVTIKDGANTTIESIPSTGVDYIYLIDNSTVAGTWVAYSLNPSNYDFTSTNANFGGATISNATWNGNTIASGYGGTGLTTFVAANNAIYSTSSSALTAGTLPVAAGGTGITSLTAGYIPYGNGTAALSSSSSLQFTSGVLVVGGTSPLGGATNPITAFTGSANNYIQTYVYNAANSVSSSADFVAYGYGSSDSHGWADMGFTSPSFGDTNYTVTGPSEAYLFGSGPTGTSGTGNLVLATDNTGSANAIQFYTGGFAQTKGSWKAQIDSTGLKATQVNATNGLIVNSMTVAANYTVASGDSAFSIGPITVNSGVTVTVSSGSRWVVI